VTAATEAGRRPAGPSTAVAAVRHAVRAVLAPLAGEAGEAAEGVGAGGVGEPALVLVACSGGADSLALAAAAAFVAPRLGLRVGGVTVDHGLQQGSAQRAATVATAMTDLGLAPVEVVSVDVGGPGGPEAAARIARYAALDGVAERLGASAVLLGHTLDDQAETVLLGLARGSGTRSLAGMAATTAGPGTGEPGTREPGKGGGHYRRPLLSIERAVTRAACADLGLAVWDDPHNADPAYARARVRADLLPILEEALGPGIAAALARTASLARDDADALDLWAATSYRTLVDADGSLGADELAALPAAVRRRVLRLAAVSAGCPTGAVSSAHLTAIDALVTEWHGQGPVSLPGGRRAARRCGRLYVPDLQEPSSTDPQ
jgi:tRNA(Ile)-lysidine synthase